MKKKLSIIKFTAFVLAIIMLAVCLFTLGQSNDPQTVSYTGISADRVIRIDENINENVLKSKLDYYEFDKNNLNLIAYIMKTRIVCQIKLTLV